MLCVFGAAPVSRRESTTCAARSIESLRNRPTVFQRPPPVQRQEPALRRSPAPVIVRDTPGRVGVEPSVFVTVFGDTLADLLASGLTETFAENSDILVSRRTKSSSGLVRDDFYDWRAVIRDYVATDDRLTYAVVMMGSNDRQALKDASRYVPRTVHRCLAGSLREPRHRHR